MDNKKYCVYMHVNKINGKIYIGITRQTVEQRWKTNGKGYKKQCFYKAIKKYGWNNFNHIILFDKLTKEEAESKEKELISYYKSNNSEFGYNIENGGLRGDKTSETTINKRKKRIICVELNKEYESIQDASDELKVDRTTISKCLNKENKTAKGFHFFTIENYDKDKKYNLTSRKRKIICIETKEVFNSIEEAGKFFNISASGIQAQINGKQKSSSNYHFDYLENYDKNKKYNLDIGDVKPKRIMCIETQEIFESIHDAGRKTGADYRNISAVLHGRYKYTHNLHFKYC